MTRAYTRKIEPLARDWRSFEWSTGAFDTAQRAYTEIVSGTMQTPYHLVLVTIRGGAQQLEVHSACGHHYQGPDRAGSVSFIPADCERSLELRGVCSEWVSIGIAPSLLDGLREDRTSARHEVKAFTNRDDPFLFGLAQELERLHTADGQLEVLYCETMAYALAHYLAHRYDGVPAQERALQLSPRQLRQLDEYLEAHLAHNLRIADMAKLLGMSEGHFHRTFRATLQQTPLAYVNEKRVRRAARLLSAEPCPSVLDVALNVGFSSPSHFTRAFRQVMGINPSQFKRSVPRSMA